MAVYHCRHGPTGTTVQDLPGPADVSIKNPIMRESRHGPGSSPRGPSQQSEHTMRRPNSLSDGVSEEARSPRLKRMAGETCLQPPETQRAFEDRQHPPSSLRGLTSKMGTSKAELNQGTLLRAHQAAISVSVIEMQKASPESNDVPPYIGQTAISRHIRRATGSPPRYAASHKTQ